MQTNWWVYFQRFLFVHDEHFSGKINKWMTQWKACNKKTTKNKLAAGTRLWRHSILSRAILTARVNKLSLETVLDVDKAIDVRNYYIIAYVIIILLKILLIILILVCY